VYGEITSRRAGHVWVCWTIPRSIAFFTPRIPSTVLRIQQPSEAGSFAGKQKKNCEKSKMKHTWTFLVAAALVLCDMCSVQGFHPATGFALRRYSQVKCEEIFTALLRECIMIDISSIGFKLDNSLFQVLEC
jgi:hypothetical protein